MNKKQHKQLLFQVMNEIGIIQQLVTTEFNRRLPENLHVSHFSVINHLVRLGDGRTPHQLSSAFQITRATMTNTLTKLSGRGFIEIRSNPEDGRSKLVYLTDEGRAFRDRAVEAVDPYLDLMDREFGIERMQAMLPTLQELRAFLDDNRSE